MTELALACDTLAMRPRPLLAIPIGVVIGLMLAISVLDVSDLRAERAVTTAGPTVLPSGSSNTPRPLRSPEPLPGVSAPSVVLSYEVFTDIPVTRGPELLVTSDGQVVSAPDFGTMLTSRRLAPAGIDALRRVALETGLFTASRQLARKLRPGASPQLNRGYAALTITLRVEDRDVRVSTFAKDSSDDLYLPDPDREELLAIAARLRDLSWLPAGAWLDPTVRPYVATFHRLYIEMLPNVSPPGVAIYVHELWPFITAPESFGEAVPVDPANPPGTLAARCAVLTAEDARALGEPLAAVGGRAYQPELRVTGASLLWPAGNGEIRLQLEPLLPHATPTCAGVRLSFYRGARAGDPRGAAQ